MHQVLGVTQHYDWGDPSFIPRLLGEQPDGRPWAEWWIGTHPAAPAHLRDGRALEELTGPLPYLLKVLAAAAPLSLQTHPDGARARAGFESGRYPDPSAKPELLHALTRFEAFCGIRPIEHTLAILDELGADALLRHLEHSGVSATIAALLRRELDIGAVIAACAGRRGAEAEWVGRLHDRYPHDPAVAVTLLLNHVVLEPGEAIRLEPGQLHAYLCGAGIELMGASDNVVRGGLTIKDIDVDELLAVLDSEPVRQPIVRIDEPHDLPAAGVELIRIEPGHRHRSTGHELAIDLAGRAWYLEPDADVTVTDVTYVAATLRDPTPVVMLRR